MYVELITPADLQQFREALLQDLKCWISSTLTKPPRNWLKGIEVRKMLGISAGTLQQLRISGKLRSNKIGGIHFYRYTDIEAMLDPERNTDHKK